MESTHIERAEPTSPAWKQLGIQHLQRYQFALQFAREKSVLDLACGPGYGSYVLAGNGASDVTGVDIAEAAITYARDNFQGANLNFVRGDGQNYVGSKLFDLVVCFETIEHVPAPVELVRTLAANLRPGGLLVLSAPNSLMHTRRPEDACDNPFHLNEPTYEELIAWVSGSFRVLQTWEQSPVAFESSVHLDALHRLQSSKLVTGLMAIESVIRRLLGKPWPVRPANSRMECWSQIFPLLPSRKATAEVFLLVCEKSS